MEVSVAEVEPQWEEAFGDEIRPKLYASNTQDDDGLLPLNDPQDFVTDITNMSHQQLTASALNNQLAMKQAQDEYIEITKLIMEISGKESFKNPQIMKKPEAFEEMKESTLYGYRYEKSKPALLNRFENADDITEREKEDVRLFQEPFEQGGFVPTARQYRSILDNSRDHRNPDGWKPVEHRGRLMIPRQQIHHDEYPKHNRTHFLRNEKETIARPGTASSIDSLITPSKPANRQLARTRFGGQKVPPTRDASEDPSATSTPRGRRPNTPRVNGHSSLSQGRKDDSPASKRRRLNNSSSARVSAQSKNRQSKRPSNPASRNSTASNFGAPPDFLTQSMSIAALRARKWTSDDLIQAVRHDHRWLNDDPNKADQWKQKIMASDYPVRTLSMFKKWADWQRESRDKRPRNRKTNSGDGKVVKAMDDVKMVVDEEAEEPEEPVKDETKEELIGQVLENGETMEDQAEIDDLTMPRLVEANGLRINEDQLDSTPDTDMKETDIGATITSAVVQKLEEKDQSSIEEMDIVKDEDDDYDAEDTIVAMTDSRPITPLTAPNSRRRFTEKRETIGCLRWAQG